MISIAKKSLLRTSLALVLWLIHAAAVAQSVTVVEYYNRALDAYFMTGRTNEQTLLDGLPADFSRTGMEFTAAVAAAAVAPQVRVCRFYINTVAPFNNSHFYGREGVDCEAIRAQNIVGFNYEDFDFAVAQPDTAGACPVSTPVRIYRSFRPGTGSAAGSTSRTANHRYSTSQASYDGLTAAGFTPENAVFCVASAKDATDAPASSFKRVISLPMSPFAPGCNGQFSSVSATLYSGAEVEPSLARNPANPNHMIASWQQDRWSNGGAQGLAGAVTFDGGKSWLNTQAIFSRCSGGNAANAGNYERASDPWVGIAPDGAAYQMALGLSGESFATSSVSAMLVAKSADGGRTWAAPQTLVRDASAAIFHDKNALTADPTNPAYVYAVWGRLAANGHGPAWFSRTTDGGLTWESSRSIYDPGSPSQTLGNQIVVMPNGDLVNMFFEIIRGTTVPGTLSQQVRVIRSTDKGANWSAPITVAQYLGVGTIDPITRDPVRDATGVPSIAVGADGGLHVVWQDARFGRGDYDGIAYSRSGDGGITWSAPAAVNARIDVAAFVPTVHVRRDGTIGVSYYDFRADTIDRATLPTVYRLATSKDGVNWRESGIDDAFELRRAPIARGYFLGDYQALSSNGAAFSALYARTGGSVANNATEIVFANVADGSLKRVGDAYVARPEPADFVLTDDMRLRINASIERTLAARHEKFQP